MTNRKKAAISAILAISMIAFCGQLGGDEYPPPDWSFDPATVAIEIQATTSDASANMELSCAGDGILLVFNVWDYVGHEEELMVNLKGDAGESDFLMTAWNKKLWRIIPTESPFWERHLSDREADILILKFGESRLQPHVVLSDDQLLIRHLLTTCGGA